MKNFNKIFALAAVAFFAISTISAATKTWTGATSTNWSTASNWSSSGVPGSGDDVIIPSNLTTYPVLTANVSIRNFTMNGGTTATSGFNFTVSNNLIINDGVFNSGTSTISSDDIEINNGEFILQGNRLNLGNDLIIDGGLLTVTGADLEIDDDIFLISGILDLNNYDFIVNDNYTYEGGFVQDPGDFIINDLIINFSGAHDLGINLRILGSMTFNNGILNTNEEHYITFDYNATVSGADNQSHINGPVRKEMRNGSMSTFAFPIGNGSVYAPLSISDFAQGRNEDYFTAQYFYGRHPEAGANFGSGLNHVSQAEYWILDRGATSGTATTDADVTLSYNESTRSGIVFTGSHLRVARWDGSQWVNHGGSGSSSSAGTVTSSSRVTSFSPFTIGSTNSLSPLPVVLLDFSAKAQENQVSINWSTSSEINNDYFNVEKSLDGINWVIIGRVESIGNSETITNYSLVDNNPVSGVQYYRLKQTDINGTYTYSAKVPVNYGGKVIATVSVFPNPASDVLNVELSNGEQSEIKFTIYNSVGQNVMEVAGNGNMTKINISNLEAGIYILEIVQDGVSSRSRFAKK